MYGSKSLWRGSEWGEDRNIGSWVKHQPTRRHRKTNNEKNTGGVTLSKLLGATGGNSVTLHQRGTMTRIMHVQTEVVQGEHISSDILRTVLLRESSRRNQGKTKKEQKINVNKSKKEAGM